MTKQLLRAVAVPATALALVAGLAACSGDDDAKDPSGSGPSASATPSGQSADQLAQQLLASATPTPAIASASATVSLYPQLGKSSSKLGLTADVVEVTAADTMTVLHWRLRSTGGESVQPTGTWLNGGTAGSDTSAVAVVDTTGKRRLLPFKTATGDFGTGCICSPIPRDVDGTGVDLYATLPALATSATTVDVAIPQFTVMKGVKVTR